MNWSRVCAAALLSSLALSAQTYDIVLANGRVMDPESGLDAVRNVGITGGRIAAVSDAVLTGKTVIDARGQVVTAGFIDLHSHGQTPENYAFKARDGVTTALEMEVGVNPVIEWYAARAGKALVHYGATSGHIPARMTVMHDPGALLPRGPAATRVATGEERRQTLDIVRRGLDEGALGIGMGIAYVPTASREEILEIFQLAAQRHATIYVHMRNAGPVEPGAIDSLQEMLGDAAATGASVHLVHISSMGLRETGILLQMIEGARRRGIDVTTEAYPYTAAMTDLSSAVFAENWQQKLGGIGYGELQWAKTGERLTEATFGKYRREGGMVVIHAMQEATVREAIAAPGVMIASDGVIEDGKGHPRGAGTFARVLARYVREQHALTLMDALRKMSLLPAERLGLQSRGRLQAGAEADITVFDPERVADLATFDQPARYSEGISHVLVGGILVVRGGKVVEGVHPGQPIRR